MMLLALLIAPIPPAQPEITSMGEADKETGLYMPFLSLLICLSLVGSCRIMESQREEKSYHWVRKYRAPVCRTVWGSLIQGLEVSSVYRQNITFAQKRLCHRGKTHWPVYKYILFICCVTQASYLTCLKIEKVILSWHSWCEARWYFSVLCSMGPPYTWIQTNWTQRRFLLFVKKIYVCGIEIYPRHLAKPTCEIGWCFIKVETFLVMTIEYAWGFTLSLFTFMHWRRKWQPTPVFLPGESQGRGSLVGFRLWGCAELDTTEAT